MKVTYDQLGEGRSEDSAIVYVVSDSLGDSANNVVLSAAAQFSDGAFASCACRRSRAPRRSPSTLTSTEEDFVSTAVFHSIVDPALRKRVRSDLNNRGILSVDILGPVVQLLAGLTGEKPKNQARAHHMVDKRYLRRVSSMDFFVEHDDGKNPQDLVKADVVLVGLSGSAKTPACHVPVVPRLQRGERLARSWLRHSRGARPGRPRDACLDSRTPRACLPARASA